MKRTPERMRQYDHLYPGQEKASYRINYGQCEKFSKEVTFIPNTCQLDTQTCFKHRRE